MCAPRLTRWPRALKQVPGRWNMAQWLRSARKWINVCCATVKSWAWRGTHIYRQREQKSYLNLWPNSNDGEITGAGKFSIRSFANDRNFGCIMASFKIVLFSMHISDWLVYEEIYLIKRPMITIGLGRRRTAVLFMIRDSFPTRKIPPPKNHRSNLNDRRSRDTN